MRRILIIFSFCLLLFSSFPAYGAQIEAISGEARITSDKLNVRSGPSKEYTIVGSLQKDEVVEVTGIVEPDWYVIDYHGEQGYIYGEYLIFTPAEVVEQEQVITTQVPMRTYLILGLGVVILLVVGLLIYTFFSIRKDSEEESEEEESGRIPITDHDNTNMHLGEVTYDTYRLDIDPSFFETTTLVQQPERIDRGETYHNAAVGKTEAENTADIQLIDSRLEQASAQLAALQREVEELKKQKQEE